MGLQSLLNSRRAGELALWLAAQVPPKMGLWLAARLAEWISNHQAAPTVQAVRSNQWVVGGCPSVEAVDQAARECWGWITRGYFEMFHYLNNPEPIKPRVLFSPAVQEIIAESAQARRGLVVCGVHMAGFELVTHVAYRQGLRGMALSLPDPGEAVEWQHALRRRSGMELVEPTLGNLRQAIQRLESGQTIVTGIDRPMPGLKHQLSFFGRPAYLPTHHITLALRARAPVILLAALMQPDGRYRVYNSEVIHLRSYSDRNLEIKLNAEHVLAAAADLIAQAPRQWAVFHPVWPQAVSEYQGVLEAGAGA
jgi:lauroyl/myristoyl acyltransferase